jgi:HEAT repeat protein
VACRSLLLVVFVIASGCGERAAEVAAPRARAEPLRASPTAADLVHPDVTKRRDAARSLAGGVPAAEKAVGALAGALADTDRTVREEAAKALRDLGPKAAPALAAVERAFLDEDVYVRWRAAEALGRIGPAAAALLPALDARAADTAEAEVVRAASERAAERIRAR